MNDRVMYALLLLESYFFLVFNSFLLYTFTIGRRSCWTHFASPAMPQVFHGEDPESYICAPQDHTYFQAYFQGLDLIASNRPCLQIQGVYSDRVCVVADGYWMTSAELGS